MTMTEDTIESGVKVVGAPTPETEETGSPPRRRQARRGGGGVPSRRAFRLVSVLAALGVAGALVFGVLYATRAATGRCRTPPS
jgi:hypothetical protein